MGIGSKLDRFALFGFPGRTAERICTTLQELNDLVPPRVCAAVLRTLFNGWCTGRRFQAHGQCMFGCNSRPQEDSIEHYACCPVVVSVARRKLRIRPQRWEQGLFITLGFNRGRCNPDDLVRRSLLVYGAYKAHSMLRYKPLLQGVSARDIIHRCILVGSGAQLRCEMLGRRIRVMHDGRPLGRFYCERKH